MTTAMKYSVLHNILILLLAAHTKFPRNFLIVCAIRYLLMALTSASKAKPETFEHDVCACLVCKALEWARILAR